LWQKAAAAAAAVVVVGFVGFAAVALLG